MAALETQEIQPREAKGQVVKLDRGFPLVRFEDGSTVRCEHATDLVKEGDSRAVIGDFVRVVWPDTHDKAIIAQSYPRHNACVRGDPVAERGACRLRRKQSTRYRTDAGSVLRRTRIRRGMVRSGTQGV